MERSEAEITALLEELAGHGLGGINPDLEALGALVRVERPGPLQFVNLLRYHEIATYPEGHELAGSGISGADAYGRYSMAVMALAGARGATVTLFNQVHQVLIGDIGPWDQVAIMQYPEAGTFIDMIRDPAYRDILVHRDAGLARTAILVSTALLPTR